MSRRPLTKAQARRRFRQRTNCMGRRLKMPKRPGVPYSWREVQARYLERWTERLGLPARPGKPYTASELMTESFSQKLAKLINRPSPVFQLFAAAPQGD